MKKFSLLLISVLLMSDSALSKDPLSNKVEVGSREVAKCYTKFDEYDERFLVKLIHYKKGSGNDLLCVEGFPADSTFLGYDYNFCIGEKYGHLDWEDRRFMEKDDNHKREIKYNERGKLWTLTIGVGWRQLRVNIIGCNRSN